MTRASTYTALNSRITHGGRSVDRDANKQRAIALLPMERAERGWAFWRKG